jgi:hypothetical protein
VASAIAPGAVAEAANDPRLWRSRHADSRDWRWPRPRSSIPSRATLSRRSRSAVKQCPPLFWLSTATSPEPTNHRRRGPAPRSYARRLRSRSPRMEDPRVTERAPRDMAVVFCPAIIFCTAQPVCSCRPGSVSRRTVSRPGRSKRFGCGWSRMIDPARVAARLQLPPGRSRQGSWPIRTTGSAGPPEAVKGERARAAPSPSVPFDRSRWCGSLTISTSSASGAHRWHRRCTR